MRGLTLAKEGISNPFKFGIIGSSDTHVGGGSYTEETHFSKIGLLDGEPYLRARYLTEVSMDFLQTFKT